MTAKNRIFNRSVTLASDWEYNYVIGGVPHHDVGTMTTNLQTPSENTSYEWTKNWKNRSWNTTPGWKAILAARGYLTTLNMSESFRSWRQPVYSIRAKTQSGADFTWNCAYCAGPGWSDAIKGTSITTDEASAITDAKTKALARARDMKVNLAVTLGEGRQTVRMIADTARKLGQAYSAFRKGHFKKVSKVLGIPKPTGTAANHWLEWAYGWLPLVSDVKGLAELAAQQIEGVAGRKPRFTARGSSRRSYQATSSVGTTDQPAFTGTYLKYNWVPDRDYGIKDSGVTLKVGAGLLCELQFTEAALAAQTGFGITDAALYAWERTPFSFVFDWFIDIGSWLESLSALQGIVVLDGFVTSEMAARGVFFISNTHPTWVVQGILPRTSYSHRVFSRSFWSGGVPAIRLPLADGLNARRIITSAALWRQRCRGDRVVGNYRP